MAENLNVGTKILGSSDQTNNGIIEKYCYNDDVNNCTVYGGLYQWSEAMQYVTTEGTKGICPIGWHLPTDAEWTVLTTFLGGENGAGRNMKSIGTIQAGTGLWFEPNGANNSSGFTGLPGGYRNHYGNFLFLTGNAGFWSSSENLSTDAWFRGLDSSEDVSRMTFYITTGFSVRCLKN